MPTIEELQDKINALGNSFKTMTFIDIENRRITYQLIGNVYRIVEVIDAFKIKHYYNELGQYHREDGPAIEHPDGTKHWYKNGLLHREDGPAIELENGEKAWYKKGAYYVPTDHEMKLYEAGNL